LDTSENDWFFSECIKAGVEQLIIDGINSGEIEIESRDCLNRTPLMVAVEQNKHELVRELLRLGANPSGKSDDGQTCLSRAIEGNDLPLLKLLVESGADIEFASSGPYSPLAVAAIRGRLDMIKYLFQMGANLESKGDMDCTPLMDACFFGEAGAVAVLLKLGSNRTAKNAFGRTAWDIAKERGGANVVAAFDGYYPKT
jgi:ankyrin repeat protein